LRPWLRGGAPPVLIAVAVLLAGGGSARGGGSEGLAASGTITTNLAYSADYTNGQQRDEVYARTTIVPKEDFAPRSSGPWSFELTTEYRESRVTTYYCDAPLGSPFETDTGRHIAKDETTAEGSGRAELRLSKTDDGAYSISFREAEKTIPRRTLRTYCDGGTRVIELDPTSGAYRCRDPEGPQRPQNGRLRFTTSHDIFEAKDACRTEWDILLGDEVPKGRECSDGKDNDGDGVVDAAADPGCARSANKRENEDPCVAPDTYRVQRGTVARIPAARGLLANDADPEGHSVAIELGRLSFAGRKLKLNRDSGAFTFRASARRARRDSIRYHLRDSRGGRSRATTVRLLYTGAAGSGGACPPSRPRGGDDDDAGRPPPPPEEEPAPSDPDAPDPQEDCLPADDDRCPAGTESPIARYAPLVYMHPAETLLPEHPIAFIENSSLKWAHEEPCRNHYAKARTDIDPWKLGDRAQSHGGPYVRQQSVSPLNAEGRLGVRCPGGQPKLAGWPFATDSYTRPWDSSRYRAPRAGEGWYLDFRDDGKASLAGGSLPLDEPVWVESRGDWIHYWFFYASSRPILRATGKPSPIFHEGDWERIAIRFRGAEPQQVRYFQHHGAKTYEWEDRGSAFDVTADDRPVVYSALGSHASYPKTGTTRWRDPEVCDGPKKVLCLVDKRARGGVWATGRDLKNARAAPWYGFGGAWGWVWERGFLVSAAEGTGPLGPSIYKR
jgi:hypothetical protein